MATIASALGIINGVVLVVGGIMVATGSQFARNVILKGISLIIQFLGPIIIGVGIWIQAILAATVNSLFSTFKNMAPSMSYLLELFNSTGSPEALGFLKTAQDYFRMIAAAIAVFLFILYLYRLISGVYTNIETPLKGCLRFAAAILMIILSYRVVLLSGEVFSSTLDIWSGKGTSSDLNQLADDAFLTDSAPLMTGFRDAFDFYSTKTNVLFGGDGVTVSNFEERMNKLQSENGSETDMGQVRDNELTRLRYCAEMAGGFLEQEVQDIAELSSQEQWITDLENSTDRTEEEQQFLQEHYNAGPYGWNTIKISSGELKMTDIRPVIAIEDTSISDSDFLNNAKALYDKWLMDEPPSGSDFVESADGGEWRYTLDNTNEGTIRDSLIIDRKGKVMLIALINLGIFQRVRDRKTGGIMPVGEPYPNYYTHYSEMSQNLDGLKTVVSLIFQMVNIAVMCAVLFGILRIFFAMIERYVVWCVNVMLAPFFFAGLATQKGTEVTKEYVKSLIVQEFVMMLMIWGSRISYELINTMTYYYQSLAGMILYASVALAITQIPVSMEKYFDSVGLSAPALTRGVANTAIAAVQSAPMRTIGAMNTGFRGTMMAANMATTATRGASQAVSGGEAMAEGVAAARDSQPFGNFMGDSGTIKKAFAAKHGHGDEVGLQADMSLRRGEAKAKEVMGGPGLTPKRSLGGQLGLQTLDLAGYDVYDKLRAKGLDDAQIKQVEDSFAWGTKQKMGFASFETDGNRQLVTFSPDKPKNGGEFIKTSGGYMQIGTQGKDGSIQPGLVSGWAPSVVARERADVIGLQGGDGHHGVVGSSLEGKHVDMEDFMRKNHIASLPRGVQFDEATIKTNDSGVPCGAVLRKGGSIVGELSDTNSSKYMANGSIGITARDGSTPMTYLSHESLEQKARGNTGFNTANGISIPERAHDGMDDNRAIMRSVGESLLSGNREFTAMTKTEFPMLKMDETKTDAHKMLYKGENGRKFEVFDSLAYSNMRNIDGANVRQIGDGLYAREVAGVSSYIYDQSGSVNMDAVKSNMNIDKFDNPAFEGKVKVKNITDDDPLVKGFMFEMPSKAGEYPTRKIMSVGDALEGKVYAFPVTADNGERVVGHSIDATPLMTMSMEAATEKSGSFEQASREMFDGNFEENMHKQLYDNPQFTGFVGSDYRDCTFEREPSGRLDLMEQQVFRDRDGKAYIYMNSHAFLKNEKAGIVRQEDAIQSGYGWIARVSSLDRDKQDDPALPTAP